MLSRYISSSRKYGKGFLLAVGCTLLACTGVGLFGIPWFAKWLANINKNSTVKALKIHGQLSYGEALGLSPIQVVNLNQFSWNEYHTRPFIFDDVVTRTRLLTNTDINKMEVCYNLRAEKPINIDRILKLNDIQLHNLNQFSTLINSLLIPLDVANVIINAIIAMTHKILITRTMGKRIESLIEFIQLQKITLMELMKVLTLPDSAVDNLQALKPCILKGLMTIEDTTELKFSSEQCVNLETLISHGLSLENIASLNNIQISNIKLFLDMTLSERTRSKILGLSELIPVEDFEKIINRKEIWQQIKDGFLDLRKALTLNDVQLYNLSKLKTKCTRRQEIICKLTYPLTDDSQSSKVCSLLNNLFDITYDLVVQKNSLTITQMISLSRTQIDILSNPAHIMLLKSPWIGRLIKYNVITLEQISSLTPVHAAGINKFLSSGHLKFGVVLLIINEKIHFDQVRALSNEQQTLLNQSSTQILAGKTTVIDILKLDALPLPLSPMLACPPTIIHPADGADANDKFVRDFDDLKMMGPKVAILTPEEISLYSNLIENSDHIQNKVSESKRLREYEENIICGISQEIVPEDDTPVTVTMPPSFAGSCRHHIYSKQMLMTWAKTQRDNMRNTNLERDKYNYIEDPFTRYPLQYLLQNGLIKLGYSNTVVSFIEHVRKVISLYLSKLTHSTRVTHAAAKINSDPTLSSIKPPARELRLAWLNKIEKNGEDANLHSLEEAKIVPTPTSKLG